MARFNSSVTVPGQFSVLRISTDIVVTDCFSLLHLTFLYVRNVTVMNCKEQKKLALWQNTL